MAMLPTFKRSDGKPRAVQVFECPSTDNRRTNEGPRRSTKPEALSRSEEVKKQFQDTLQSVRSFSTSHATGKEKKKLEAARIEALGGKAQKQKRMPINQLLAMRKAAKKRELYREELAKTSGVVTAKKKSAGKVKKRGDAGVQATKGRLKNGVLFVSKHDR